MPPAELLGWLAQLPATEKDDLLLRVARLYGASPMPSGVTLAVMPTTRPRIMVTETDELATALDAAAARYPGLSRAQLLTRLALEGDEAAHQAYGDRRRHRLDVLRAHSGSLTGVYGPRYLEQLRQEWPA